jgi:hypothetical protein
MRQSESHIPLPAYIILIFLSIAVGFLSAKVISDGKINENLRQLNAAIRHLKYESCSIPEMPNLYAGQRNTVSHGL